MIAGEVGTSVGQERGTRGIKKDDISGSAASIFFLFFFLLTVNLFFFCAPRTNVLEFLRLLGFTLKVQLDNRLLKVYVAV